MTEEIAGWLRGRLPESWFDGDGDVDITSDRDEVLVVGPLAAPEAGSEDVRAVERGRIARFREDTRDQRIAIAREIEHRWGTKVSWGARCGETRLLFTTLSVPVMTRLRQPERVVLDTLVGAGVARSRSDALAWCVRLVGRHTDDWLRQLREAMQEVQRVRDTGPDAA